ncbi:MAG: hypothetical protein HCA25_15690 [Dolichospermum sp. DET50]|nr:hypothetical protein [Dolichospermum sp. DET50]
MSLLINAFTKFLAFLMDNVLQNEVRNVGWYEILTCILPFSIIGVTFLVYAD